VENFPHHYSAVASAAPEGDVRLDSAGLPVLSSAPPREFDGPGDRWSPETMLTAAVADCFILTFRAIAQASNLTWTSLECRARGTVDRVERIMRFTRFDIQATLRVPAGTDEQKARRLLAKAEQGCLVRSSLTSEFHLDAEVEIAG
jgi:organic hydroperoxide reductase OsmC/OhrA